MKKNLLQFLFLPLAGLLTLALLALTVLSCIPQKEATLRETEDVTVSSSVKTVLGDNANYACLVTGRLFNTSNETLRISCLRILMEDEGGVEVKIQTKGYILPSRASINLLERLEHPTSINRVRSVTILYEDGTTEEIPLKANQSSPFRPVLLGALTLAAGGLVAFLVTQTVYAAEEERLKKEEHKA